MRKTSARFGVTVIGAACLFVAALSGASRFTGDGSKAAAGAATYPTADQSFLNALEWRPIGPFRGGRATAVAGDPDDPLVFYMGTAHGGVWKTNDAGLFWRNVSDPYFKRAPVGAMEVSRSNHEVIYVAMGESEPRQDDTPGDGVYKSTDGGRTWTNVGLREVRNFSKIRIHPTNPDIVYAAAMGDIFGTNPERGVFRTKDGGKTWQRVLFKSDRAVAFDLTMDPTNPNILFASLDQFQRFPWDENSGGPDSGLYKTTDGGDTWTEITRNPGLPKGLIGKIGLSISPPRPTRVYAIIEAVEGGVYRSDDSGATWQKLSDDREQRREAASYLHITADTQDPDTVYVQHVQVWKSTDGGKTFTTESRQHSDHHAMWIDPKNSKRIIDASDGGASVTLNGGLSWSTIDNQPTADLFSLAIDNRDPYNLYAAQNDGSHIGVPSRTTGGGISWPNYLEIPAGEGGQTAVKPDGSVVYACDRTTITRYDRQTGQQRNISVWPEDQFGAPPKDVKYRFYYSFPIYLSPHDPNVLYTGAQFLFRTTNEGDSWEKISPDLSRNRVDKMQKIPGGPINSLASSLFYVSLIRTIAESPVTKGELWVGTDDSNVQLSKDAGKTWENVSPKDLPEWTTITAIDVSPHDRGTAYVAGNRVRVSDLTPYFYKTTDYGRTWQKITNGIRENDFAYVIREDPVRQGLLFAGTETGAYVSFDAGASWQSLQRNLPPVAVAYMQVKNDDLVVATHGRGFWIMDTMAALRQITPEVVSAPAHLFEVPATERRGGRGGFGGGRGAARAGVQFGSAGPMVMAYEDVRGPDGRSSRTYLTGGPNPPAGVPIEYYLKQPPSGEATLTIVDSQGHAVQKFSSQAGRALPAAAGMNRFFWDMRYPGAREAASAVQLASFEASRPVPPVAPPGRYLARLIVGGQTYERPFEIRRDSRGTATDADLQAQFDLLVKIRDKVSETSDALTKLREVRRQFDTLEKTAATPTARADIAAAKTKLLAIETVLTRLTLSHSLEVTPKGLINKLGTLSGTVATGEAKPTRQQYELFDDLSARIAVQLRELQQLITKEVPGLTKEVPGLSARSRQE
jgi:photosystem II stability/assembly factor-like uncharacterized protein